MNKKGKLRAFTLTELLVVMALASIVVGLGGYIYAQFMQIASRHSHRSRLVQEVAVADRCLWLDVLNSRQVRLRGNRCVLKGQEGSDSTVYEWTPGEIKRIKGAAELRMNLEMKDWTLDSTGLQGLLRITLVDSSREIGLSYLLPGRAMAREDLP